MTWFQHVKYLLEKTWVFRDFRDLSCFSDRAQPRKTYKFARERDGARTSERCAMDVEMRRERLYESFRAVTIGWRFTARTKFSGDSSQKWRYLKICEFNWDGSNFPPSVRSRHTQECICCVCLCVIKKSVLTHRFFHGTKKSRFSWKFDFSRKSQGRF